MSSKKEYTRQWSSLPADLLSAIVNFLPSRLDVQRFRGVCSAWRHSVAPPPSTLNHKYSSFKLPYIFRSVDSNPNWHYKIMQSITYHIEPIVKNGSESTMCWLVKLQDKNDRKMRVIDPISSSGFSSLPWKFRKVFNLLEYKVREVSTIYGLNSFEFPSISKVAICDEGDERFSVILIQKSLSLLAIWREGCKKWSILECGSKRLNYQDVICHKGNFYVAHACGPIFVVDPFRLTVTNVELQLDASACRFVKADDELFLVIRKYGVWAEPFKKIEEDKGSISVYKLDQENDKWDNVSSLGDFAFFIGENESFSLSVMDFHGFKPNCIYFDEKFFSCWGFGFLVLDLQDKKALPLFPWCSKYFL